MGHLGAAHLHDNVALETLSVVSPSGEEVKGAAVVTALVLAAIACFYSRCRTAM